MKKPATTDETGATRNTDPTSSPRPATTDNSVESQRWGKAISSRRPWSSRATAPIRISKVRPSTLASAARNGGVRISRNAASASTSIGAPFTCGKASFTALL